MGFLRCYTSCLVTAKRARVISGVMERLLFRDSEDLIELGRATQAATAMVGRVQEQASLCRLCRPDKHPLPCTITGSGHQGHETRGPVNHLSGLGTQTHTAKQMTGTYPIKQYKTLL